MGERICECYDGKDSSCSPKKEPWESYVVGCGGNSENCVIDKEKGLPKKLEEKSLPGELP